ncbi:MAG TPA: triose-phosphate isomerase [Bacteroidales bacterium]|nr:triose-phosphate isomerase [Bacteroidales bacterium]
MKPKIVAANWKMNTDLQAGMKLAADIDKHVQVASVDPRIRIILAVPFTHISEIVGIVDYRRISVAAQNCAEYESGAYTGEISPMMIKSTGAHYVIIGHSERRHIFMESNAGLKNKVDICLKNAMRPIFCCGETLENRKAGEHKAVVKKQLEESLFHIDKEDIMRTVIAYEPVWAIGTGETASPEQAQEMHAWIRELLKNRYESIDADAIPVLYGGSMKPANASELLAQNDINGGLVGGASLKTDSFMGILKAF